MFKKIITYSVFFVAFLLISLPYAAKFSVVYYLENEENMEANISDLNFNVFTGKMGLEGVHLYGENGGELHLGELMINVSLLELLNKNILIESINFHDFSSNINELENGWNIGGMFIPLADPSASKIEESPKVETEPFDWGYGVERISFSNIKIQVSSQYTDGDFVLKTLKVKDALSWQPEKASGLELALAINGNDFQITGEAIPFVDEPLINTQVKISNVQLRPFTKSLKDLPFDELHAELFSDFQLTVELKKEGLQLVIDGEYGLNNIHLVDAERDVKLEQLIVRGKQQLALTEKLDIQALLSLSLNKLNVNSRDGKVKLAAFDRWDVSDIKVSGLDDIHIALAELKHLSLLKELEAESVDVVTLDKFMVSNIAYQPNFLGIDHLEFNQLLVDVRLNGKGDIPALSLISKKTKESKAEVVEKEDQTLASETNKLPEDETFTFVVKDILIKPNSRIRFIDHSVTPLFDTQLHQLKLHIKNVNSLDTKQSAGIDFSVNIDEYAKFLLNGDLRPFGDKLNAKLVAKITALELVPLSSYAGKFAGMNIQRGVLDFDAKINIKNDELDVENTFYLSQLKMESDETEVNNSIFKDMPMPLNLTLDVLRDKQDVIKLDIPVKGDVNKPDFSLQDIYNKAMGKAMKFAATHYLLQAVQPLGLAITAGKLIGKAMVPKFDPLIFEAGSSEISVANKKHIKKLANVLRDKDKLKFTICGSATSSDWRAIKPSQPKERQEESPTDAPADLKIQVLLTLANERTKLVKKYFVEKYNIAPKRLFACNGKIAKDEEDNVAVPAVSITL